MTPSHVQCSVDGMTVEQLANHVGVRPFQIISDLMEMNVFAGLAEEVDEKHALKIISRRSGVTKEEIALVQKRLSELKPLPETRPPSCENCAMSVWLTQSGIAECHRFPPAPGWPRVHKEEWCGEWRKK